MRKRWKIAVAVGLACVVGVGWAVGSPQALDVQEPQPEIPLYEGAQIEWEVHLTAQEMGAQLGKWAHELSVLKISGYTIEGERALEALDFYDQALSEWRRIFWAQPSEAGGARIFAHRQSYLFIGISKKYEATELIVATAQAGETTVDAPIFEGAELQWEIVLTEQDLLEHLKRRFGDLIKNPPSIMRMRWQPERSQALLEAMAWLGVFGIEAFSRLLMDFSELRIVGYRVGLITAPEVIDFYERQYSAWRRNLWIKPDTSGSVRVFTRGGAQGLQDMTAILAMPGLENLRVSGVYTGVIVLRARR